MLKVVTCYFHGCTEEVVGEIRPTHRPDICLFVCRSHYESLAQVYFGPQYEAILVIKKLVDKL